VDANWEETMTKDQWRRLQELFDAVVELPAARRAAFLDQACDQDFDLRRQVESLVVAGESASKLLGGAVESAARVFSGSAIEPEGERLGPYRLLREIGRGGMGQVYLAVRDDDEFRKQVAVKLIRTGMESAEALLRFRAERQILADLEHPNIARLLDGGTTANGLPFVVMEYVGGLPLAEYCRTRSLGTRQRLELFRKVCGAVQFAHQHLVVHRDLKPGNILVGEDGEPKLLDFGIAKLLGEDSGTPRTRTDMRLMTPEYASPEQVMGLPVSTATDVYSLGVILYEVLAGQSPYTVSAARPADLERAIREIDPQRPSAVRSSDLNNPAAPPSQRSELAGDLDNIVLKAMRKEPAERYGSAQQLSEDIQRYLEGYPVLARPSTWNYRAGKFVRRNRVAVCAGALLALVIVAFAGSMTLLAGRLARERDRSERISSFLVNVFRVADPSESRGRAVTAREVVERGAARINEDLSIQPAVRATLKQTIGQVYQSLGLHSEALPILREALDTRRKLFGERSREVAESLHNLAWSVWMRGDNEQAERLYRESLDLRLTLLGPDDEGTLATTSSLAGLLRVRGRLAESERLYRDVLAVRTKQTGPASIATAETSHNLAQSVQDQGRYAEAEPLFREALAVRRRVLGADHPDVADNLNNLALLLYHQGRYPEAEPVYRESLALRRKVLGLEHPDVANSLNNLALLLSSQGRESEAIPIYREAIALRRKVLGPEHQLLANTMKNLADAMRDVGDPVEATELYTEALRIFRRRLGDENLFVASALNGLALLHMRIGKLQAAENEARSALDLRRKLFGAEDHRVADSMATLALVLAARGPTSEAQELFRTSLRIYRAKQPPVHPSTARPLQGLGDLLIRRGAAAEAEPLLREALAIRRGSLPPMHWSVVAAEKSLADCRADTRIR